MRSPGVARAGSPAPAARSGTCAPCEGRPRPTSARAASSRSHPRSSTWSPGARTTSSAPTRPWRTAATGTAPAGVPATAAAPRAERFRGSAASCSASSVRPRRYEQCQTPPLRCGHEVEHCEIEHCGVTVVQHNDQHREPSERQVAPGTVPTAEMPERDVAELATELTGLAGRIAAQTCQFLVLLGEFDAREGWGQYAGILSCAHWLSWQCGMSNSTAREHVRVARALRDLPLTQSEFAAGRLSYSKVRAITRVATPEREPELVDIGRAGTAAQLDRFCAAARKSTTLPEVNQRHTQRTLSYTTDEDGSLVLHAR